jgi:integrase
MTRTPLKIHTTTAKGHTYHYAWRGGPRLKSVPGTPEFYAEMAALTAPMKGDAKTLAGLIVTYKSSPAYTELAQATRTAWAPWLDRIGDQFGKRLVKTFDDPAVVPHIRRWRDKYRDTPRTADMGMQVFSRLLSFGAEEGLLTTNPCSRVPNIYSVDRSEMIWTEEHLAILEADAENIEIVQAARLAALTSLRKEDLLRLSWHHIKANSIEIETGKSGGMRKGKRTAKKVTLIPLYAELRAYLAALPKRGLTVLTNTRGDPWGSGFNSSWNRVKSRNPEIAELHFHDLRGTAVTRFHAAGLSTGVIAEILTWSEDRVQAILKRYVRRNNLTLAVIAQLDANGPEGAGVKPTVKPPEVGGEVVQLRP